MIKLNKKSKEKSKRILNQYFVNSNNLRQEEGVLPFLSRCRDGDSIDVIKENPDIMILKNNRTKNALLITTKEK